ncbi:polysaccharide biosynthesis protein [Halovivax asiaticus JCM 14624]|uniref:Polysaccharide biosynthesis protein n=1 Tax=Halovivax asiaticus JCM 14624 TaxID=1227490 RepID=M0BJA8_9EURY|nr:polysaccharide biosynthesis C-terminal domain-containing protein [Halovivax asiaticus]ELZ10976.1 polysaccharide biosynthesis protein [Halovivax asiaticus JCM 14624]
MSRSITRGFVSILGTKVLVLALGIVTSPLLATLLGESDYGDYSFLLSAFSIFMIFVSSGVTDGVQKFLGENRSEAAWSEHVVGFYFRLAILLGLAGSGLMVWFAGSDLLPRLVEGERFRRYFVLLAGLVVAAQFRSYVKRTLMGFGLEPYAESLTILHRFTFVGIALGLAALGYGVEGVLVGHIVGSTVPALVGFVLVARRVSILETLRIPPRSFPRRELLSFNGMSIVLVALLMSLYHVDVMMIRVFVDGPSTAFYKVALVLAEFLWVVPMALQTVLLHSTSELWSRGDHERVSRMAAKITRYTLLLTALLAVGIATLAPIAIPLLWPDEYVASLAPLYLLLPGAVGFAIARPVLAIAQANGNLRPLIAATGVVALVNVVLNWVLIAQFGMHGAAVATSVSYGLMFFLHVWSARRLGFDPLADARPLRVGVTIGLSAPLVVALSMYVEAPLLSLAIVPVGGAAIFAILALLTGAIGFTEVLAIASSLPVVGSGAASLKRRVEFSSGADAVRLFQRVLMLAGVVMIVVGASSTMLGTPIPMGDDDIEITLPDLTSEPTDPTENATGDTATGEEGTSENSTDGDDTVSDGDDNQSDGGGIGDGNESDDGGIGDGNESDDGGSIGDGNESDDGGSIGDGNESDDGGSIGDGNESDDGGSIGDGNESDDDGSIGDGNESDDGSGDSNESDGLFGSLIDDILADDSDG